jgi:hypothetical protein
MRFGGLCKSMREAARCSFSYKNRRLLEQPSGERRSVQGIRMDVALRQFVLV